MNKKLLVALHCCFRHVRRMNTPYSLLEHQDKPQCEHLQYRIERRCGASPMQEPIKLTPAFTSRSQRQRPQQRRYHRVAGPQALHPVLDLGERFHPPATSSR